MDTETRQRLADGQACLQAALEALDRGWSVLPLCPPDHVGIARVSREHSKRCAQPGKVPWIQWKDYQEALPTKNDLKSWWRDLPTSNLGIALGPVSGVIRVDVEGAGGELALQEKSKGVLPPTVMFRSGRVDGTGRGLLYGIPLGALLRTTYEKHGAREELRFQAKGAQTVLPPSRHVDGGLYEYLPGHGPTEMKVEIAPAWLLAELAPGHGTNGNGKHTRSPEEWETLLQGVGSGARNDTAAALAGKLVGALRDLDDNSAVSMTWQCLRLWNDNNDPPMSDDELKSTFASILRSEKSRRERESSEILNRRIHQEIAVANEQKANRSSCSEHSGANGTANGVSPPAPLPAWDLIELQGEPTSYLLRAPGWLDSPRLKDGYLPLSVDEILHWGGQHGIYRAAFARAGVVVETKVKDWGSPGGGLEKLMETVKVVQREAESHRNLYVLGYLFRYLETAKPLEKSHNGRNKLATQRYPIVTDDAIVLFRLPILKKKLKDDKEDITNAELMHALENNGATSGWFQGARWWKIDQNALIAVGKLSKELEDNFLPSCFKTPINPEHPSLSNSSESEESATAQQN